MTEGNDKLPKLFMIDFTILGLGGLLEELQQLLLFLHDGDDISL